jgi:hypothetical protein
MREHPPDHRRLVPGGHEDGEPARPRGLREGLGGLAAEQAKADPDQIDEKIAKPKQKETESGEQGRLAHDESADRKDGVEAPQRPFPLESEADIITFNGMSRKKFRKAMYSTISDEKWTFLASHFPGGAEAVMLAP